MRLFLGFSIPDDLSLALIGVRDQALRRLESVRPQPVVAGNFHMTLLFLGERDEEAAAALALKVDSLAMDWQPFPLMLSRAHCFPDSRGRVFAAEAPLTAELEVFHQRVARLLGEPVARPLRPHITLARLTRAFVPAPDMALALPYVARELCLYESRQSQWGVRYSVRRRWSQV